MIAQSVCASVGHAVSGYAWVQIWMGLLFRKTRKPDVDMRVYAKAVDAASVSLSSCVGSADPAAGVGCGCPSVIMSA